MAYATVDDSVTWVDKRRVFIGKKPLGAVPKLAIVKYPIDGNFLLLYCSDEWEEITQWDFSSSDEAKRHAEAEYVGLGSRWQDYHHADEAAVDRQCMEPFCGFCGRSFLVIEQMVEGKDAYICGDCIKTMSEMMTVKE